MVSLVEGVVDLLPRQLAGGADEEKANLNIFITSAENSKFSYKSVTVNIKAVRQDIFLSL